MTWVPVTRESIAETEALICETVGFDRATFLASAFLRQNDAGAFANARPAEQKDMLFALAGLEAWEQLRDLARARIRQGEIDLGALQVRIDQAEVDLASKPDLLLRLDRLGSEATRLDGCVAATTIERDQAAKAVMDARETGAKIAAARTLVAEREQARVQIDDRVQSIRRALNAEGPYREELAAQEALAGKVPALEAQEQAGRELAELRADYERRLRERTTLAEEANRLAQKSLDLEAKLAAAEGTEDGAKCDRCDQTLGREAKAAAAQSYRDEIAGLEQEAQTKRVALLPLEEALAEVASRLAQAQEAPDLATVTRQLTQARAAVTRVAELETRLEHLDAQKAEADQLGDTLAAATLARDHAQMDLLAFQATLAIPIEELEAALLQAEAVLAQYRNEAQEIASEQAVRQAELQRLAEVEAILQAHRLIRDELQGRLAILRACETAYGRDGIPTLVLENVVIPIMEQAAQRFLGRLGGKTAGATVELRTQREKKTGGGLAETFEIVVLTSDGYERKFGHWSGGEQLRLAVALRLGLMEAAGIQIGVFVLDEPAALDDAGKTDLVQLLSSIHELGVDRVLLISHEPELRDAFSSVIEVVSDGARSRVLSGATLEVAA